MSKHTKGELGYSVLDGTQTPATLFINHNGDELDIAVFEKWEQVWATEMEANAEELVRRWNAFEQQPCELCGGKKYVSDEPVEQDGGETNYPPMRPCRACQQPLASEFTKDWRRKLEVALFKMGKSPDEWFQSIVTGFREACKIIDRAEATNKGLLAACEGVRDWLDTSSLQQVLVHSTNDKRVDALIMGIVSHLTRIEAAIAEAKKGGE